jgi:hypothetical protein
MNVKGVVNISLDILREVTNSQYKGKMVTNSNMANNKYDINLLTAFLAILPERINYTVPPSLSFFSISITYGSIMNEINTSEMIDIAEA